MPTTPAGRRLTEAHRLLQARLGAQTVEQTLVMWRLLDVTNLDATTARWVKAMIAVIQSQRAKSAAVAAAYLQHFRTIEIGQGFPAVIAPPAVEEQLATSMIVRGPVSMKANMARGLTLIRATDLALAGVAGAAQRHTIDAGRETITETVRADPRSRGWVRVVSGSACDWCLNLEGVEFSDDNQFDSHDRCSCSTEPQFD
jgi:hypothetical protein